jgi:hypothetical protein
MAFPLRAAFLRRLQPPAERPPCPPPSASSLLIAPRAAEVSGALLPQLHLFPAPSLHGRARPGFHGRRPLRALLHPFSHSTPWKAAARQLRAFPMAPPFAHSLPAPFLPLASNGTAPPCSYSLARQQLPWRPENSSWLPSSSSPISSSSQQAIPSAVQSAASFSRPCQQHAMAGSAPSMGVPCCSLRPALSIQHAPFSSMKKTSSEPPSSLFIVVPAGYLSKCAASRALQQPSSSFSTSPSRVIALVFATQRTVRRDARRVFAVFGADPLATSSTLGETSRYPCCLFFQHG